MKPALSIIIPFGLSKERDYLRKRVVFKARFYQSKDESYQGLYESLKAQHESHFDIYSHENSPKTQAHEKPQSTKTQAHESQKDSINPKQVEFIFVEGFSSDPQPRLQGLIKRCKHRYLKDEKQQKAGAFSLGKCRNLGISHANADVVMVLDADCHLSKGLLGKILELIAFKDIANNPNAVLFLPCAFLTQGGNDILKQQSPEKWDLLVQAEICKGKSELIRFVTPASSSFVMNKQKFLELGGFDRFFTGHGYEDFDFMARVLFATHEFEKMPAFLDYDAKGWNFRDFKGFRALFALAGGEAAFYGLYIYHFWHDEPNQNGYFDNIRKNHDFFYKRLKTYVATPYYATTTPLQATHKAEKRRILFAGTKPSHKMLKAIETQLGKFRYKPPHEFFCGDFFDEEYALEFLDNNSFDYVFFPNPYGEEKRRIFYEFVRKNGFKYIVFERGALNDSWFLDDGGFNYDSDSYDEKRWLKKLLVKDRKRTQSYINEVLQSEKALEKQGERLSADELRKKLNLGDKRVIFAPLQVASDTVIKHFTYEPFTWENFFNVLDRLGEMAAKQGFVVLAKKHPLTLNIDTNAFKNVIFVDEHFLALIELCEFVVLLNSGVGLYAMMMQKPAIVCANAFYSFDGLNLQARDEAELQSHAKRLMKGGFKVDKGKMLAFIRYLREDFYSFGKSVSVIKMDPKNNRKINATVDIDFYQLNFKGKRLFTAKCQEKVKIGLKNFAYKPFLYEILSGFKDGKAGFKGVNNAAAGSTKGDANGVASLNKTSPLREFFMDKRIFRLLRKLKSNPKRFILDSKKPYFKPLQAYILKKMRQKERDGLNDE